MEVAIRFGGMGVKCIYLVHSPKVKKIELVTKGSGCFKSSIKNGWHKFNKATLTSPKIRKRVMKNRLQGRRRKATAGKQTSAIKFDTIINDNVRRLV